MNKITKSICLAICLFFAVACDRDDDNEIVTNLKGNYLVGSMVVNTETFEGRCYIQLVDRLAGQELTNANALPMALNYPKYHGEDVYIFPAYTGKTENKLYKYKKVGGDLVEIGYLPLETNSAATNIVIENKNRAYLSMAGLGSVWIFNPTSLEKLGEINLSLYAIGDNNPDPGAMVLRDGLLYVGLNQLLGNFVPAKDRNVSDIAIIDTKSSKVIKIISENESGMSFPTRPINDGSIFVDEKEDIYIACFGGFGMLEKHKTGFLRIKKGETDFDKTYSWDITNLPVTSENYTPSMIQSVCYFGNGILYTYLLIPAYNKGDNLYSSFSNKAVEIDLYAKTIKPINSIPLSSSFGVGVYKYKDEVVFCNYSKGFSGLYSYKPNTEQTKELVKTTGFPTVFYCFE